MGPSSRGQSTSAPKRSYEDAVEQEVERLQKLHPTTDDIPSCMKLLETYVHCNSTLSSIAAFCDSTEPLSSKRSTLKYGLCTDTEK